MHASEKDIQGQKDSKLVEWRDKLASVEAWLAAECNKLETDKNGAEDLNSITKQKRMMEVRIIYYIFSYPSLKKS